MSPGTQIFLSGALSFGVPLVLAARELFVLRRRGGGSGGGGPGPVPRPTPPLSWQPSLPPLGRLFPGDRFPGDGPAWDPADGERTEPRPVRVRELA